MKKDKIRPAVARILAHNFAPASIHETTLYGASRAGYPLQKVDTHTIDGWTAFMQKQGISRICCLLGGQEHQTYYDGRLIERYHTAFGKANILNAPIEDYNVIGREQLYNVILPFIAKAETSGVKVVVHCSAGIGRAGQVLFAWLVKYRHMSPDDALTSVMNLGRNPLEALGGFGTAATLAQELGL